jgi:protein-ribulosamine 3-kinase
LKHKNSVYIWILSDYNAMLSTSIVTYIGQQLSINITAVSPVSGGSINSAYCLHTANEKYFVKVNSKSLYPGMFKAEAAGLNLIAKTSTITVPKVVLQGNVNDESLLVLEWIDARRPTMKTSELLGVQLAKIHFCTAGYFGLNDDNYMGSLHQSNKKHDTWSDFFISERLMPMVKMAVDKHLLTSKHVSDFEQLYKRLPGLFTEEPPSSIHGDLWGGNYLISEAGCPYLIDPAISYGNREFDIAMTTLFGGFSDGFYAAYNNALPLNKGWEGRLDLWNLYPLLLHLNLFGMGYLAQVVGCLKRYL